MRGRLRAIGSRQGPRAARRVGLPRGGLFSGAAQRVAVLDQTCSQGTASGRERRLQDPGRVSPPVCDGHLVQWRPRLPTPGLLKQNFRHRLGSQGRLGCPLLASPGACRRRRRPSRPPASPSARVAGACLRKHPGGGALVKCEEPLQQSLVPICSHLRPRERGKQRSRNSCLQKAPTTPFGLPGIFCFLNKAPVSLI